MGVTLEFHTQSASVDAHPPQLEYFVSVCQMTADELRYDIPQKVSFTGSWSLLSSGLPPYVMVPIVSLYSPRIPVTVFRNVVHPEPGLPITSTISPLEMVPEKLCRRVRENSCRRI